MTPIQQQRLIGAGLLVLLVAVLAYVVLSKVGQYQTEQTLELPEPIEFSSVIEPIDKGGVETIQDDNEAMVDADSQQITTAQDIVIAENETEAAETQDESVQPTGSTATETPADKTAATSQAPKMQPMVSPSATSDTTESQPASVTEQASSTNNADAAASEPEPKADTTTSGDRWLIQLGSFSVQNNAQSLKAAAEKLGYKPYIEKSETDKGPIYRVRLPEIANRAQADEIAAKINTQLNIKTQVSTL